MSVRQLSQDDHTRLERYYYRHVMASEISERSKADLSGAVRAHLALAAERPQGTVKVRVYTPTRETDGWTAAGRTVIEIVTDDMPFLVDSVTGALTQADRDIDLVVHPQIVVQRDITGVLLGIGDAPGHDRTAAIEDGCPESWMHLEIDQVPPSEMARIEDELRGVLRDVRDAVEDWQKMGEAALRAADDLVGEDGMPGRDTDPEITEAWELMRWLADNHFTFLGYREYELTTEDGPDGPEDVLRGVPGTGLGIMRSDVLRSGSFDVLTPEARARARDPRPLIITKSTTRSTVHRPGYLDYIGVKKFVDGEVVGERRFLGLFSRAAYTENVARIPVLRRKVDELYELTGFIPNSYSGRDLLEAIETYPRDELFQTPVPQLYKVLLAVLHLKERKQLRLFLRSDEFGRFVSALVYLPRDRYNTENRLKIQDILLEELDGTSVEFTSRVTESVLARLHFVVRVDPALSPERRKPIDAVRVEGLLVEATRTWRESLHQALEERYSEHEAANLTARYAEAFPAGYRESNSPSAAVDDLTRLEALPPADGICVRLYEAKNAAPGHRRFSVYRRGPALSLSEMLPVLQHLGVEVTDEQPYRIELAGWEEAWIYDFGLRTDDTAQPTPAIRQVFEDAFLASRDGRAESDGFNKLVPSTGLTWRQVSVLRAYAKYLRQTGSTFGHEYLEQVVHANSTVARTLVLLFEARFDPKLGAADDPERVEVCQALTADVTEALDRVASLDADRILRAFLALIHATLRTNYWVPRREDEARQALAFKFDPHRCPDLPAPRPMFEIWVYSPAVEGVHLRFGPVARGGLRWSDRREDFRTEILGLVKAQMVKNTVIVPVGAKGGFVVKRPPTPTGSADADREAFAAEGVACYRTFIGGMLDVTDNLVAGELVPARLVVRHDPDDAYLVVAADKGTAKFSDIANEISLRRGFWLGDAFASGGSVGYDHKAMGITARGAWESVKRHFRERGIDCQSQEFTCVGIGDMSGDVFGNGMLLSRHIRLVAAFDHRHIFLDPDPDAAASFAERERLFALPRSSWADYDLSLISEGGGVHPRTAKSIPITAQVRAMLGLAADVTALAPNDLLRAILLAEVDLLWNGGIGTYVKASTETHAEVGDKANDAIRVDGADLRAAAVGEGGNLGFTQRGRIEYALLGAGGAGGRVNTDAIDNSAGVDTSDHEVNIKILLDTAVATGSFDPAERDALLASMTDEVAQLVLHDNYAQNVALANALAQAPALLHAHTRLIRAMEHSGGLDRALEFLPSDKELAARAAEGKGLTAPELSVLLAYTKIGLNTALLATDLPDSAALARVPVEYFPVALRERLGDAIQAHPLRREILTTVVVNDIVNDAGITFLHRIGEESAAPEADIARAYLVARDAFDLEPFREDVAGLDNKVAAGVQTRMRLQARRLAERATRWLLAKRRSPLDIDIEVEFFSEGVTEVLTMVPKMVRGADADALAAERDALVAAGVPHDLAERAAAMDLAFAALDIVEVSRLTGFSRSDVAEVYFLLADKLAISRLLAAVNALPRDDRWKATARASIREDLFAAHAALTADVLAAGDASATPHQHFAAWRTELGETVDRAAKVFDEITAAETLDLAMASVAMRAFRSLLASPRG